MKELLFLAHRIPFPPNKGDKIRSFNLLKHLSRDYRIHLGAFIDDPSDWIHLDEVRAMCAETLFLSINPNWNRLRSLSALISGEPLTLPYYRHRDMQAWVNEIVSKRKVERILVFSAAMAQYIGTSLGQEVRRVIDFVDVDSDKWLQYSRNKAWPMNWLYRREGKALLYFERAVAANFDASVFVSAEEAALFRRLAPESARQITHVNNGVDTDFFIPDLNYPNPYPSGDQVLVFTGAMDYWANVDAVCWFAQEVFPRIRQCLPGACFYIVGARPIERVRALARLSRVYVTGAVSDIRPYLAYAKAAVAPLRIARGVQNKILEAMAMAKPVLATRLAMDGIMPCPGLERLVADEPRLLADLAVSVLTEGDVYSYGIRGRAWVTKHYNWSKNLRRVKHLLEGNTAIAKGFEIAITQSSCYRVQG